MWQFIRTFVAAFALRDALLAVRDDLGGLQHGHVSGATFDKIYAALARAGYIHPPAPR